MSKKVAKQPTTDQTIKEVQRLAPLVEKLADRVREVERVCRILCDDWRRNHLTEERLTAYARQRNSLDNAFREIKRNLKVHGNEFDREPHMDDPDPYGL